MASVWGGTRRYQWLAGLGSPRVSEPPLDYSLHWKRRLEWHVCPTVTALRKQSGAGRRGLSSTELGPVPFSPWKATSHCLVIDVLFLPRPRTLKLRRSKYDHLPFGSTCSSPEGSSVCAGTMASAAVEKHACLKGAGGPVTLELRFANIGSWDYLV